MGERSVSYYSVSFGRYRRAASPPAGVRGEPCLLTRVGFLGSRLGTASRRGGSGVDAEGGPLWPPAAEVCVHLGKKPTRERTLPGAGNPLAFPPPTAEGGTERN